MKKTFYSNGKLLITSEYLVLDGAKALALPTKFGQNLTIEEGTNQEIHWTSYDYDNSFWFEDTFTFSEIKNKTTFENQPIKSTLITILHEAFLLSPFFLNESQGYTITTQLTFPKFWGLGTSSTLLNNIAQWLQIDAYTLLKNSFGGSGYDIACAQNNSPILYQLVKGKPRVEKISFEPKCISNLYFVYLNQKQNSKAAIASYYSKSKTIENRIPFFDAITDAILKNNDFENFSSLLLKHENEMSTILELPTIKNALFSDFKGTIKSLGAWGGDFVLVVSKENPTSYFREKGFETILPYSEMIL
jgi:mevalonate kinase